MKLQILACLSFLLLACATKPHSPPPPTETPKERAMRDCNALAKDLCGRLATQCEGEDSGKECFTNYQDDTCPRVSGMRNADDFEKVCLPWLKTVTCDTMRDAANSMPPECLKQFQ